MARWILGAAAIVGAGFLGQRAYQLALTPGHFAIEHIAVTGAARASEAELMRLSGLQPGLNLFSLDPAALERAMLGHPWVKSVRVQRRFPSRLDVDVIEHEPSAIVSLGELYLVDASGQPFKRLQPQDDVDLPIITGLDRDAYVERPDESRARIALALEVMNKWSPPPAEVRTSPLGITVVAADGQEVRLGEGDLDLKLQRLERVRSELKARRASADVIRLDNKMRPTWVTVQLSRSTR